MTTASKATPLLAIVLAAFLILASANYSSASSAHPLSFQSGIRALTVPGINFSNSSWPGYGTLFESWYGGLQPYNALTYFGQSPNCNFDNTLFNISNDIWLPDPGYFPNQQFQNYVWIGPTNDSNITQYFGYYCIKVIDSQGSSSINSSGVYFGAADVTTISSTTSLLLTSSVSTINYNTTVYPTTTAYSSSYLTTTIAQSQTNQGGGGYCALGHICNDPSNGCAALGAVYNCPNMPANTSVSTTVASTSTVGYTQASSSTSTPSPTTTTIPYTQIGIIEQQLASFWNWLSSLHWG